MAPGSAGESKPEIIAHRGYSARAPENTLASLGMALDVGATSLEWDLHTAACGTPVLFHDTMLGRTTNGVGPIRRRPLGQLQALDAGSWFSPDFAGEKIPSQADALEHVGGRVTRIYQEVKGYREMEDLDRMISLTAEAGLLDRTVFMSHDWIVLNRLRDSAPDTELGYLVASLDHFQNALDRAVLDGRAFLNLELGIALEEPSVVTAAVEDEVVVGIWTVNDVDSAQTLYEAGASRFTTNEVELLGEWAGVLG
jgi:glycerophosphoryl diester phosphodiesterase